jgi:hypothetical protein
LVRLKNVKPTELCRKLAHFQLLAEITTPSTLPKKSLKKMCYTTFRKGNNLSERHLATLTLKPIPRKEVVYQSSGEIRLSLTVDQETLDLIEHFKASERFNASGVGNTVRLSAQGFRPRACHEVAGIARVRSGLLRHIFLR